MKTTRRASAEPVLIAMSILAAGQAFFASAGLVDAIGAKAAFIGMLTVGAIQVGVQFYVRGRVVASDNVVAAVDPTGEVVAGPALLSVPEGVPVQVDPAR